MQDNTDRQADQPGQRNEPNGADATGGPLDSPWAPASNPWSTSSPSEPTDTTTGEGGQPADSGQAGAETGAATGAWGGSWAPAAGTDGAEGGSWPTWNDAVRPDSGAGPASGAPSSGTPAGSPASGSPFSGAPFSGSPFPDVTTSSGAQSGEQSPYPDAAGSSWPTWNDTTATGDQNASGAAYGQPGADPTSGLFGEQNAGGQNAAEQNAGEQGATNWPTDGSQPQQAWPGDQQGWYGYGQQDPNTYGQHAYGQNAYGQQPYTPNPYDPNTYGQHAYDPNAYGQQYGYDPNAYGQQYGYNQQQYGQQQYPYGQQPYDPNAYGQQPDQSADPANQAGAQPDQNAWPAWQQSAWPTAQQDGSQQPAQPEAGQYGQPGSWQADATQGAEPQNTEQQNTEQQNTEQPNTGQPIDNWAASAIVVTPPGEGEYGGTQSGGDPAGGDQANPDQANPDQANPDQGGADQTNPAQTADPVGTSSGDSAGGARGVASVPVPTGTDQPSYDPSTASWGSHAGTYGAESTGADAASTETPATDPTSADPAQASSDPTSNSPASGDPAAGADPWPQGERTQMWPPAGEVQPGAPLGTASVPGAWSAQSSWSAQSYDTGQAAPGQPVPSPGEWPSAGGDQNWQQPNTEQPASWLGFGQPVEPREGDHPPYGQPGADPHAGAGPAGFQPQGPPPQPGHQPGAHSAGGPHQGGPGGPGGQGGQGAQGAPTAADFAARRAHRPEAPKANQGVAGILRKASFGLVKPAPGRREVETRNAIAMVRRNFGGLRQVTVVNPKGGAGKTVAVLMIGMTCGQQRGGYVLAWDNNETQGTLGMRAQQDFHARTVRDLLSDLQQFTGPGGRVGDLSKYVRAQGEAMFDVLASDESATAGEMLTSQAFAHIREVVSRFYKLIIVDTGNNVRAANWQSSIEATDQLVVPMSARGDSAETASRMLDHLDQTGRHDLVRDAVSVISMPASTKGVDLPAIRAHFAARTRQVLTAPYEPLLDSGEPIRYEDLSQRSRLAWLRIAAAVSEGL